MQIKKYKRKLQGGMGYEQKITGGFACSYRDYDRDFISR